MCHTLWTLVFFGISWGILEPPDTIVVPLALTVIGWYWDRWEAYRASASG